MRLPYLLLFSLILVSGCDRLGIPDPARDAAQREAEARATGSACRHAGRGIEDCYALNPDAGRAAVYAGWREMNDYMRENKIEDVKPELPPVVRHISSSSSASSEESASSSASGSASASAH